MIVLTEYALRTAVSKRLFSEATPEKYVAEAEAVVNQRPLTALDTDGIEILRPADFLNARVNLTLDSVNTN